MFDGSKIMTEVNKGEIYSIIVGFDLIYAFLHGSKSYFTVYTNASYEQIVKTIGEENIILHSDDNCIVIDGEYRFKIVFCHKDKESELRELMEKSLFNIEKVFYTDSDGVVDLGGQWCRLITGQDYCLLPLDSVSNEDLFMMLTTIISSNIIRLPTNLILHIKEQNNFMIDPGVVGICLKKILSSGSADKIVIWENLGITNNIFPEFHYLFDAPSENFHQGFDTLGLETINVLRGATSYISALAIIFYQIGKLYSIRTEDENIKIQMYENFEEKAISVAKKRMQYFHFDDEETNEVIKLISLSKSAIPTNYSEFKYFIVDNFENKELLRSYLEYKNLQSALFGFSHKLNSIIKMVEKQMIDSWGQFITLEDIINNINLSIDDEKANQILRDIKWVLIDYPDFILSGKKFFIESFLEVELTNTYSLNVNPKLREHELVTRRSVVAKELNKLDFDKIKDIKTTDRDITDDEYDYVKRYDIYIAELDYLDSLLIESDELSEDDKQKIISSKEIRKSLLRESEHLKKLERIYIESDTSFFEEVYSFISKNEISN